MTLEMYGRSMKKITVVYDPNRPDDKRYKRLESAIFRHCRDSLTHLVITNGQTDTLSYCRFPHLTHLTFDGHMADSSTTLFTTNSKQLKFLELHSGYEEAIHKFLYNFKDVDFGDAKNLILSIRVGIVGSFPSLIGLLPKYLNGLQHFEVQCGAGAHEIHFDSKSQELTLLTPHEAASLPSWSPSINKKVTHIISNGTKWSKTSIFTHFRYANQRDYRRVKEFIGNFDEILMFIDIEFSMEAAVAVSLALSEKTKLTFCYDVVNGETVSFQFINDFHTTLKQKLGNGETEEFAVNFDPRATIVNEQFCIRFEGVAVTVLRADTTFDMNVDPIPPFPFYEGDCSDLGNIKLF